MEEKNGMGEGYFEHQMINPPVDASLLSSIMLTEMEPKKRKLKIEK